MIPDGTKLMVSTTHSLAAQYSFLNPRIRAVYKQLDLPLVEIINQYHIIVVGNN